MHEANAANKFAEDPELTINAYLVPIYLLNKPSNFLTFDPIVSCLLDSNSIIYDSYRIMLETHNLLTKTKSSQNRFLSFWSQSLKKTSPSIFYDLSEQCVKLSESNELLNFFKTFFKEKVYIYGEKTQLKVSKYIFGPVRYKIKNSGHFSFFESKLDFCRIFRKLLLKKYK